MLHAKLEGFENIESDGEEANAVSGDEADDIEEEGVTDIAAVLVAGKEKAVIETGMKKRANAKASAAEQARAKEIEALDLVTVKFREHNITLGKERHRFCEPLFDPTLLEATPAMSKKGHAEETIRPLQTAVGHAVGHCDVDQRQYIWQGLFVTGEITDHIKGWLLFLRSTHILNSSL